MEEWWQSLVDVANPFNGKSNFLWDVPWRRLWVLDVMIEWWLEVNRSAQLFAQVLVIFCIGTSESRMKLILNLLSRTSNSKYSFLIVWWWILHCRMEGECSLQGSIHRLPQTVQGNQEGNADPIWEATQSACMLLYVVICWLQQTITHFTPILPTSHLLFSF